MSVLSRMLNEELPMRFRLVATLLGAAGVRDVPLNSGPYPTFEAKDSADAWRRIDIESILDSLFGGVELVALRVEKIPTVPAAKEK
jgi:hypothetical protein